MVADTVWVAVASGGSAVAAAGITGLINRWNTRDRLHEENERIRAEFYLGEKVEALTALYGEVEQSKRTFLRYGDWALYEPISEEGETEVREDFESFEETVDYASLFLTEEQHETAMEYFNEIWDTRAMIFWRKENPDVGQPDIPEFEKWDRAELLATYRRTKEMLRAEINEPIRQFEDP